MSVDWQPGHLSDGLVKLVPVKAADFDALYEVASDPLIWEQHPERERYKAEVFRVFFDGAIASGTAFLIVNQADNRIIGSTRFYDFNEAGSSVAIGYTFLARAFWGGTYNRAVKKMMLDYAFQHVNQVLFHVGPDNIRSQKAVAALGAKQLGTVDFDYYGRVKPQVLFGISKGEG